MNFHVPVRPAPYVSVNTLLRNLSVSYWTEAGLQQARFKHLKRCIDGKPGAVFEVMFRMRDGRLSVSGYLWTLNRDASGREVCRLYSRVH